MSSQQSMLTAKLARSLIALLEPDNPHIADAEVTLVQNAPGRFAVEYEMREFSYGPDRLEPRDHLGLEVDGMLARANASVRYERLECARRDANVLFAAGEILDARDSWRKEFE